MADMSESLKYYAPINHIKSAIDANRGYANKFRTLLEQVSSFALYMPLDGLISYILVL